MPRALAPQVGRGRSPQFGKERREQARFRLTIAAARVVQERSNVWIQCRGWRHTRLLV
jgi:hypothetical protein